MYSISKSYLNVLSVRDFPIYEKVKIVRNTKTRNKRNFQQTNMLRFIYHWANMNVFCNKHKSFWSIFSSWWQRWCNFTTLSISYYDCVAIPSAFMTISKNHYHPGIEIDNLVYCFIYEDFACLSIRVLIIPVYIFPNSKQTLKLH